MYGSTTLVRIMLWISKGDEVIVPAQTHTATSHVVEYSAKVIFADIDLFTGNLSLKI